MAPIDVVLHRRLNHPRELSDRFRNLLEQMASESGARMSHNIELEQMFAFWDFLGIHPAAARCSRTTRYLRIDDDDDGDDDGDSIDYIRKYRIMVTAINLQREVVALRPAGHPDRALSCAKLARSLITRYERTHDVRPLNEAITLERETVSLRPAGQPDRASSCASLAYSIQIRFNRICARLGLPHKVIDLQREAVALRPAGHVDYEQSRVNLVRSLWMLYKYSRSSHHHMDEAIALEREVLALHPAGSQHHALSCSELASSLRLRQDHISKYRILITAINLQREVVALRPAGHPDRALSCANLANSLQKLYERMGKDLRTHYDRTGDLRLLITAVDLQREVVAFRPADHPDRVLFCASLANSLWVLYNCTGADHHMDEAIAMEREVLALQSAGPIDHASCCAKLARSLITRYERTHDVRPLNEAITLEREAISLRPAGHPDRASSCASLANSLRMRCDRTFDLRLLTEAVDLQCEVVALQPARHPDRKKSSEELANSLQKLYERTGDDRLLDETINLQREVLAFHPPEHRDHGLHCRNLSMSLWTRYKRTGDDHLLDESIDLQREAINLLGRKTNVFRKRSIRALSYASLANSLWALYERSGNDHHLNEAIDLDRKALALRPPGDPHRASSCASLAISLMTRYERTREDQLRIEARSLEREAIALRPQGHPDRPLYCVNLAASLTAHYEHSGDEDLLHQAVGLANEIVAVVNVHAAWRVLSSLAWVHFQYTSSFYNVSEAVACLLRILEKEPDNIFQAVSTLRAYIDHTWDHRLVHERVELSDVYQRFATLLPLLASLVLDLQPQLKALRECSHIGSDAFVNAALAGKPTLGVETLELAQGVIWSQSVHRRDPQLKDVPDYLASQLQDLLRNIATGSASESYNSLTQRDIQHSHSSNLYALVREIRTLPGLDRFMLGENFETLRAAAIHHPVAVLVSARDHHYAFVMAPWLTQGSGLVSLDLRDEDLQNLLFTTGATRLRRGGIALEETQASAGRAPLKKTACSSSGHLDGQLSTLWHKVVKPVLDHLGLKSSNGHVRQRLHWCPTGIFGTLPLHAAGLYEGAHKVCCSDFVVSSYTPTVTTLLRAQRDTTPLYRSNLSLTLVSEKRAQEYHLETIPGVDVEIRYVAAMAKENNIGIGHQQTGFTTVAHTAAIMQTANIVHLACHGVQDAADATQSGFCLGDGRLTIPKLMELKFDHAFLAFLSACETAKGDKAQPDQAMHLAAAMLFSGFKCVVATIWAIADVDGPKVAKWFYEDLFAKEVVDADSVAYALDSAVGKLRQSGVSADRWVPFIHMGA